MELFKNYKLKITEKDIVNSNPHSISNCPICVALQRDGKQNTIATFDYVGFSSSIGEGNPKIYSINDQELRMWLVIVSSIERLKFYSESERLSRYLTLNDIPTIEILFDDENNTASFVETLQQVSGEENYSEKFWNLINWINYIFEYNELDLHDWLS